MDPASFLEGRTRETKIRRDAQGRWFFEDDPLEHPNLVRAFDRDQIAAGTPAVVQDYEANLELTYQAQIVAGWTVQPVLTYVWHPNGDRSRNATVAGARSVWRY